MFANRQTVEINPDFVLQDFEPAYMQAYRRGELPERVELALKELEDCCLCPRDCHVNRLLLAQSRRSEMAILLVLNVRFTPESGPSIY